MIYIYEGCDGSGKSTKAQQDAISMNAKYVHNPVDWKSDNPYQEWLNFFMDNQGKDICVDRSFIGNPIYRTWDNGYGSSDFTQEQMKSLLSQSFVFIYCETGTEYEDATSRGEDNLKTKEDYEQIKYLYHLLINKCLLHNHDVYVYNWRENSLIKVRNK